MAWQRRAKEKIAQGWKWMRKQDSDAAAEAERWAEEHKEDMKEIDRVLYRSDESYYGKTISLDPKDAESIDDKTGYPDPEAFCRRTCVIGSMTTMPMLKIRIFQRILKVVMRFTSPKALSLGCMI